MSSSSNDQLGITPAVITWARIRAGYTLEQAERYFKRIEEWEAGGSGPTYKQLEIMSDRFRCPVAVFFFPAPPAIASVQQSFRTLSGEAFEQIPRTVKTIIRKAQAMQLNLSELYDGKPPASKVIVDSLQFPLTSSLRAMASAVRDYLGVSLKEQCSWASPEEALEQWRNAFGKHGVFVFKDAFHSSSYFGFCLYDPTFPIIYVNNSSSKTRQIFTMFHELAHILFRTSGIDVLDDSFIDTLPADDRRVEVICNAFAGTLLVPDDSFDEALAGHPADRDTAALLAEQYNVSREVIFRKMLDRNLVTSLAYTTATTEWEKQKRAASSGGSYYYSQIAYLGPRYIDLAFARYHQGRFDEARLAQYLNIKPKNLPTFELKYEGLR